MGRSLNASTDALQEGTARAPSTPVTLALWVKNPIATGTTSKALLNHGTKTRLCLNAEEFGGGTAAGGAIYFARSWSTTDQLTEVQAPANLAGGGWAGWNHIAVTYDGSATGNVASIYVNGVLQTNSFTRAAAGTIDNAASDKPTIGNNLSKNASCQGVVAEAAIWSVVLTAAEIAQLAAGAPPESIRFASLDTGASMVSGNSPEQGTGPTNRSWTITGTTALVDHPSIAGPPASSDLLAPGPARPGSFRMPHALAVPPPPPTGTLFTLTLTALGTGAPSFTLQTAKVLSAAGSGTASMAKRVGKLVTASGAGTASMVRMVAKSLAATGVGAAVINATKVILLTLTASGTGSASIIRQPRKTLSAAGTGSPSIARLVGKLVSAAGAGAPAIVRQPRKTLAAAGTGTPSLSATRVVLLTLTALGSGAASMARLVAKSMAASGTGTPAFQKLIAKTLGASGTGTPTIATLGPAVAGAPGLIIGRYP